MRSSVTATKWRSFPPWRADENGPRSKVQGPRSHHSLPDFGLWTLDFGLTMFITFNPIDVGSLLNEARPSDGGVCVFLGVVRAEKEGRATVSIQYHAYGPMAEGEMARIARQLEAEWPDTRVTMIHRAGSLGIGEVSVADV